MAIGIGSGSICVHIVREGFMVGGVAAALSVQMVEVLLFGSQMDKWNRNYHHSIFTDINYIHAF